MTGLGLGLPRRLRELGRLRTGDKVATNGDRTRPHKLSEWRLTSPSELLLTHASELYGGDVRQWVDAPGEGKQWELYTDTDTLDVLVPPGALSAAWEMWSRGGCQRRCDGSVMESGEVCQCPADLEERLAAGKEGKACKPMTRLSVVLPRLPDVGVWRVTTSSINAGIEMPGTVDLLEGALANRRLIPASLIIEQRTDVDAGKTRHYTVPVLSLHSITLTELQSGEAFGAIGPAPAALTSGGPTTATDEPTVAPRPTINPADPKDIAAITERINKLGPKVGTCFKAFRAKFGAPADLCGDQIEAASAFVASYEDGPSDPPSGPTSPPNPSPPRDPPYAPEGGGAGDRSPRPSSPPPREQSAARQEPPAASEPVEVRSAPRPAPQPPKSGQPVPAEVSGATAAVTAPSVLAQLDDALAKSKAAPKPPADVKSTAVKSSDRSSGSPTVEGRSEGITTYQPAGGGPPLPVGITDAMLYGGANLSIEDEERVNAAWGGGGARLLQARMEWLDAQERAKNPRPPAFVGDTLEAGPIQDMSPVDKARGDLAAAKARSGR